ncbi:tRNA (adenosine(37)-N6)-threonylcarbamoyltransferase complex dimerization subunit type 1 TsaB [Cellulomonas fimi]|uniref:tRNA (Adenosine(37)-N6)-threonylcarbamoyltransferase complex dimerization subunit type 1 TsaB n=1 Tax=Cellulomonas fimi TaxID=1708 RepID=A0A7Y0LW18_CELFI|nr:tRNA (adenosine(37)-N6)-threonylcarbamoyltransferase complex dimerization subunit type 1 TsaB [Cellulomonas fimi]NMR18921.1 tRNA (adenosine(37)-N6)-threonylcarbamoyltransferase complex dimerization subunit type 1 TsaB [Cellulomonas fimi]
MPVLALDTSAAVAVALVADDGDVPAARAAPAGEGAPAGRRVLAARVAHEQRRHAELLAPMVVDVLAEASIARGDLTGVVAGTGPAPFTGLRVGLVTARALALALDLPLHGVCSLDARAAQAVDRLTVEPGAEVLVVTDARRREVYWARYRATGQADPVELVAGPGVATPAQVVADGLAEGAVVVGPGAVLYAEVLPPSDDAPVQLDPAVLARLALARAARGVPLPTEPLYLRRPDVMPPAERKRALG